MSDTTPSALDLASIKELCEELMRRCGLGIIAVRVPTGKGDEHHIGFCAKGDRDALHDMAALIDEEIDEPETNA